MTIASAVVAIAALLFTVGSFWWIQARRGKLLSFPPSTFAGCLEADSAVIRLPLSIFNDGAVPIVVTDLRLRLVPLKGDTLLLHCRSFRKSVQPVANDVEDFAHPWCVPGRAVVSKHVEFASLASPASLLAGTPVTAIVDCQRDQDHEWIELLQFELHIEIMAHIGRYITYSNQEHAWQLGLREEAAVAFKALRTQIAQAMRDSRDGENSARPADEQPH